MHIPSSLKILNLFGNQIVNHDEIMNIFPEYKILTFCPMLKFSSPFYCNKNFPKEFFPSIGPLNSSPKKQTPKDDGNRL